MNGKIVDAIALADGPAVGAGHYFSSFVQNGKSVELTSFLDYGIGNAQSIEGLNGIGSQGQAGTQRTEAGCGFEYGGR